jgi:hypothetical protein
VPHFPRRTRTVALITLIGSLSACSTGDAAPTVVAPFTTTSTSAPTTTTATSTVPPATTIVPTGDAGWPESVLERLVVDDNPRFEGYDRDDWGGGWSDDDHDCLNTRHEVLMAEEISGSPFLRDDGCLVTGGWWYAAFTGTFVDDPRSLDVDHFVPLANAHRSGGWAWDAATRRRFANDQEEPRHLIAVTASANRSKSDKGPETWRPDDGGYWCTYADTWMDIKVRWALSVTSAELSALRDMLATCDGDPGVFGPPDAPISLGDPVDLGPSLGDSSPSGDDTLPNPGNTKNCSDFDNYPEAKEWFDRYVEAYGDVAGLDRDGNGEPCESLPDRP